LHGKSLVQIRGGCYRATPRHQSQQHAIPNFVNR
jgi:hypothetical protein